MSSQGGERQLQDLVRRFRRRAGLTQEEAAKLAGISTASLRDLEQARVSSPRPRTLRRLAAAFDLSDVEAGELLQASRPEAAAFQIGVLGPLTLVVDGTTVNIGSTMLRTLLAFFALSVNTPVTRDVLVEAAWPAGPPAKATDLLQTHVSRLRRRIRSRNDDGSVRLVATSGGYQLSAREDQVDVGLFRRYANQAREAVVTGEIAGACDSYRRAADLWRDRPVADLPGLQAHPIVAGLAREWQRLVVDYATVAENLGRHRETLPHLQLLAESDPLHEGAHAHLMIALAGTGQQAAALDVYHRMRRRLADDLGANPGPELADAHQQVLRGEFSAPDVVPVSARRQLPPDIADFVGRHSELDSLHKHLPPADNPGPAVAVTSIEGMAGVGKTRLAVHFAHRLLTAGRFSDVQLYVDLRGHADQPPADPSAVLASFLQLLGVPGRQIPRSLDERAAVYRHLLHDQRALVLLDNAADEAQVGPLLPAGPGNFVLTTSRRVLALDGARRITLDVFTPEEATGLLAGIVGQDRVTSEAVAARQVSELCGGLPLAVALAAHRLQSRPAWRMSDIAARLREGNARLDELAAGTRRLRAVFDLSYDALPEDVATVFRCLGMHPGDDFTVRSAAALTGYRPEVVRALLDRLVDERLATVTASDRYCFHDLLREYARYRAERSYSEDQRTALAARLLRDSIARAHGAVDLLHPLRQWPTRLPSASDAFTDRTEAEDWLEAERGNLVAIALDGGGRGEPLARQAMWLTQSLFWFLYLRGYLQDLVTLNTMAVSVARRLNEAEDEARSIYSLAMVDAAQHHFDDAIARFRSAADIWRRCGDTDSEQRALCNLANGMSEMDRHDEALALLQKQLAMAQELDNKVTKLPVVANLGCVHRRLGDLDTALRYYGEGLTLAGQIGDHRFSALLHQEVGQIHLNRGELDQAHSELCEALGTLRKSGGRSEEPSVLIGLSRACGGQGMIEDALNYCTEALTLAREIGDRRAEHDALKAYAEMNG
jgi:DNA-binding SARP family transcriptional activator/tetratricopeptide (TPR) repeat protein/DNA-binding XRE family transcriptional regulator